MGHPTRTEKNRVKQERARRRRRFRLVVAAAVLLPVLAGGVYAFLAWSAATAKSALVVALENQDGQKVALDNFRGKQLVALFFYMVAT